MAETKTLDGGTRQDMLRRMLEIRIAEEEMAQENARLMTLRSRLWDGLKDMEEVYLNGDLGVLGPLVGDLLLQLLQIISMPPQ